MANPKKREKVLMIVTGGIVVIFLMNMFVCGDKSKQAVSKTVQKVVNGGNAVAERAALASKMRKSQKIQQINLKGWGADPFLEAARISEMDSSWVDSTDFVLRGIIWKGNQAHALIGDVILKEGERNGDLKVLNINKSSVVCRKGSRLVTLALRNDNE